MKFTASGRVASSNAMLSAPSTSLHIGAPRATAAVTFGAVTTPNLLNPTRLIQRAADYRQLQKEHNVWLDAGTSQD